MSNNRFIADLASNTKLFLQKNRIINGAFDFWQRGASFTTNVYGADRWINVAIGGSVVPTFTDLGGIQ